MPFYNTLKVKHLQKKFMWHRPDGEAVAIRNFGDAYVLLPDQM